VKVPETVSEVLKTGPGSNSDKKPPKEPITAVAEAGPDQVASRSSQAAVASRPNRALISASAFRRSGLIRKETQTGCQIVQARRKAPFTSRA